MTQFKGLDGNGYVPTGEYRPPRTGEWYLPTEASTHPIKAFGRNDEYNRPTTIVTTTKGASMTEIRETEGQLESKAIAGAAYLDVTDPNWAERIVVDELDLGSGTHCVIGQAKGGFTSGVADLGLSNDQAVALGFNTNRAALYEALTAAWIPEIKKRQVPKAVTISNGAVSYTVQVEDDGYGDNLRISRNSGGATNEMTIRTRDKNVWREVGEAVVELANS